MNDPWTNDPEIWPDWWMLIRGGYRSRCQGGLKTMPLLSDCASETSPTKIKESKVDPNG
jgi:hypothetical protein